MTGRGGIGLLRLRARALLRRHPRGALSHPWFDVRRGNGCWLYTLREGQG